MIKASKVPTLSLIALLAVMGNFTPACAAANSMSEVSQQAQDVYADLASLATDQLNHEGKAIITGGDLNGDKTDGVRMLLAAISRNDSQSMLDLGRFYLEGNYLKIDTKKGVALLEQAGRAGNGEAYEVLAELFLWGDKKHGPIVPDVARAKTYIEQAVKLGSVDAKRVLGEQLVGGWILKRDTPRGVKLLEDGIAQGDKAANLSLAKFYFDGRYLPNKVEQGRDMLLKAADSGDTKALIALASGYMWGGSVSADSSLVLQYLTRAQDAGSWDAKRILGEQLIDGLCVPKDAALGVKKLRELSDAGDVEAKRILGEDLISGWAIDKNFDEGVNLLREAARLGSPKAPFSLAKALAENRASDADFKKGNEMLSQMAKDGDGDALEYLGNQRVWSADTAPQRRETQRLLSLAGEAGKGSAWLTLAQAATFGKLGPDGKAKYSFYAQKAINAQVPGIEVLNAQRWMWGMNSRKPSWSRGVGLLESAANSGNGEAAVALIEATRDGNGWNVPPAPTKAGSYIIKYGRTLTPMALEQQKLLIQVGAKKTVDEFASFSKTLEGQKNIIMPDFLKSLTKLNRSLSVYLLQAKLKAEGRYTGPLDGMDGALTLKAARLACAAKPDTAATCNIVKFSDTALVMLLQQ